MAIRCTKGDITCHTAYARIGSGNVRAAMVGNLSIVLCRLKLAFYYTDHTAKGRIAAGTACRIAPLDITTVDTVLNNATILIGIFDRRCLADYTADTELLHSCGGSAEDKLYRTCILTVLDNCLAGLLSIADTADNTGYGTAGCRVISEFNVDRACKLTALDYTLF